MINTKRLRQEKRLFIKNFRFGTPARRQVTVDGKLCVPIITIGIRLTLNPWVVYLFYFSKRLHQEKRLLITHFRSVTLAHRQATVKGKLRVQMDGKIPHCDTNASYKVFPFIGGIRLASNLTLILRMVL